MRRRNAMSKSSDVCGVNSGMEAKAADRRVFRYGQRTALRAHRCAYGQPSSTRSAERRCWDRLSPPLFDGDSARDRRLAYELGVARAGRFSGCHPARWSCTPRCRMSPLRSAGLRGFVGLARESGGSITMVFSAAVPQVVRAKNKHATCSLASLSALIPPSDESGRGGSGVDAPTWRPRGRLRFLKPAEGRTRCAGRRARSGQATRLSSLRRMPDMRISWRVATTSRRTSRDRTALFLRTRSRGRWEVAPLHPQ